MKTIIFSASVFLALFFFSAQVVSAKTEKNVKTYTVKATVKKIYRHEKKITLDHEAIKGYMNAMVMTFAVADSLVFDKVSTGSTGMFTLRVENGFATVTKVKLLHLKASLYYCPMHPKVTSNEPGECSICGMDLEKRK